MRLVMLSGGVGGARLARGVAGVPGVELTVVVNVGDDEEVYGLTVCPDLDTVAYTMAGIEGTPGWGIAGDTHTVMEHLADLGIDTTFAIGDGDLATSIFRTIRLSEGVPLSDIAGQIAGVLELTANILPATNDRVRTQVWTGEGGWRSFQDYFVFRGHQDVVHDVRFRGAERAQPAPGVIEAIEAADAVIIGPSNPPLSIWPTLAIPGIADAVERSGRVIAVSPLFGGRALKGPAAKVLGSLGLPPGNEGIVAAYGRLLTDLVIDQGDAAERGTLTSLVPGVHVRDTRFAEAAAAVRFGEWLVELL